MDDSDPHVAALGLILAALGRVGGQKRERGVGGCWQSRGKLSRPSLETPSVAGITLSCAFLGSKYPACQFKALNICSAYLCFHICIAVIKSGTEMEGVCAVSRMACKAVLEFPTKPGVCVFLDCGRRVPGKKNLGGGGGGGGQGEEHATSKVEETKGEPGDRNATLPP